MVPGVLARVPGGEVGGVDQEALQRGEHCRTQPEAAVHKPSHLIMCRL